jgi:hypothetical protein
VVLGLAGTGRGQRRGSERCERWRRIAVVRERPAVLSGLSVPHLRNFINPFSDRAVELKVRRAYRKRARNFVKRFPAFRRSRGVTRDRLAFHSFRKCLCASSSPRSTATGRPW